MTDDEESPRHRSGNNSRAKTQQSAFRAAQFSRNTKEIKTVKHPMCAKSENNGWIFSVIQHCLNLKFALSLIDKGFFWVMGTDTIVRTNIKPLSSLKDETGRDEHFKTLSAIFDSWLVKLQCISLRCATSQFMLLSFTLFDMADMREKATTLSKHPPKYMGLKWRLDGANLIRTVC